MKRKILSGVFALALLLTAGYGVNKSMNGNANLNDLALANMEALAIGKSNDKECDNYCIDSSVYHCYVSLWPSGETLHICINMRKK